jgi:hypothetical protein
LTIDGFGPRGITPCGHAIGDDPDLTLDAYRGPNFLVSKHFVDSRRVAVVGFAWGAMQTLSAVEHGEIERTSEHKYALHEFFHATVEGKWRIAVGRFPRLRSRAPAAAPGDCQNDSRRSDWLRPPHPPAKKHLRHFGPRLIAPEAGNEETS